VVPLLRDEFEECRETMLRRLFRSDIAVLVYIALAGFAIHLFVNLQGGYGLFRDEFYYLACADHLAFGYVDHPPLSIALLAISRFLLGDSLFAIRILPAIAGAFTVFFTGMIVREIGGRRFAQVLASLTVLAVPYYLAFNGFYSMNAFDLLIWTLAFYLIARILSTGNPKLWLWFGVLAGLGMQNKISVLFLGFGLLIGLLLTPQRKNLASKYFWAGALLALLLFIPHIIWQIVNGWPTLEFISNAQKYKISDFTVLGFFVEQIIGLNPLLLPVWGIGLLFLLFGKNVRKYRLFGLMYLAIFAALVLQRSKPYYLMPCYPILFAAGAVFWEGLTLRHRLAWLKPVMLSLVVAAGMLTAPMALPILPVKAYIEYAAALGLQPRVGERHQMGELPQYFADMHGWENMVATIAAVYHSLSDEEKAKTAIFVGNYGEAGAIDYYRHKYDLPRAISGHNAYWYWGPRGATGEIVIYLGGSKEELERYFHQVEQVDTVICQYCMPYENNLPVFICRGLRVPLKELWPQVKHFE
jgi:hypothetical protein